MKKIYFIVVVLLLFYERSNAQNYSGIFETAKLETYYGYVIPNIHDIVCYKDPSYTNSFYIYLGSTLNYSDVRNVKYTVFSDNNDAVSTVYDEDSYYDNYGVPIKLDCVGLCNTLVTIIVRIDYDYTTYQSSSDVPITNSGYIQEIYFLVVVKPLNPVTGISLNSMTIDACSSNNQLIPAISPSNASVKDVTWESDDQNLIIYSQGGIDASNYTDYKRSVKVTATTVDGGYTADAYITVNPGHLESVTLTPSNNQLFCTQSIKLQYSRIPECSAVSYSFSSSNPTIASVNSSGTVTAGSIVGTAVITITATDSYHKSVTASATIHTMPYIRSVSISGNKAAGFGNILTITGGGFGSSRGNGYVSFTSADADISGEAGIKDTNKYDYIGMGLTWSDGTIKMYLPSNVRNFDSSITVIGSGNMNVKTNTGGLTNMYDIDIPQAFNQAILKNGTKIKSFPSKYTNTDGTTGSGIKFRLSPSIAANINAVNIIKRVFADLSCQLQLDIAIDQTNSSKNIIQYGNTKEMETEPKGVNSITGTNFCYRDNYIITISNNSNIVWSYNLPGIPMSSPTNYDFYCAFLHEMGHVLSLDHVNNQTELMYKYENSPGGAIIRIGGINSSSCLNAIMGITTITSISKSFGFLSSITTGCIIPAKPSIQANPLSPWDIKIQWTPTPTDVDAYNPTTAYLLYREDNLIATFTNGQRSYLDSNAYQYGNGNTFTYKIQAKNNYGLSDFSYVTVTTPAETVPPIPKNVYLDYDNTVSWSYNRYTDEAIGYKIYSSPTFFGTYTTTSNHTITYDEIQKEKGTFYYKMANKNYFYKLVAFNDLYSSNPTDIVFVPPCSNTSDLTLTVFDSKNPLLYAQHNATVNYSVPSNESAVVEAGHNVHFSDGFSAKQGCNFHASISDLICFGKLKSDIIDSTNSSLLKDNLVEGDKQNSDNPLLQVLPESKSSSEICIFPNPTKGIFTIIVKDEEFIVELYNTLGIVLTKQSHCQNQTTIDISNYATGSYFLKVVTNANKEEVLNIFKE
jgi:uncharacterized protein YjdB